MTDSGSSLRRGHGAQPACSNVQSLAFRPSGGMSGYERSGRGHNGACLTGRLAGSRDECRRQLATVRPGTAALRDRGRMCRAGKLLSGGKILAHRQDPAHRGRCRNRQRRRPLQARQALYRQRPDLLRRPRSRTIAPKALRPGTARTFHGRLTANGETLQHARLFGRASDTAAAELCPRDQSQATASRSSCGSTIAVPSSTTAWSIFRSVPPRRSTSTAAALPACGSNMSAGLRSKAATTGCCWRRFARASPAPAPSQVMVASAKPFLPARRIQDAAAGRTAVCPRQHACRARPRSWLRPNRSPSPERRRSRKPAGEALRTEAAVRAAPATDPAPATQLCAARAARR